MQSTTQILYLYNNATGMVINMEKSNLTLNNVPLELQQRFRSKIACTLKLYGGVDTLCLTWNVKSSVINAKLAYDASFDGVMVESCCGL